MSIADRWIGMPAGECPCGGALIWDQVDGVWVVRHDEAKAATYCGYARQEIATTTPG